MKAKNVLLTSALLVSVATFAQKDQLKAAEKAIKKGNLQEVPGLLNQVEPLLEGASDAEKAQYYYLRETVYMDAVDKNVDVDKNLLLAANASKEVVAIEKKSGKQEYTAEAKKVIAKIKEKLVNGAIEDSKESKFKEGADKLTEAYKLDKKDTLNLYYASSFRMNAKDFDGSLKDLQELRKLKFTGKSKSFIAKNVMTDKEEAFATAADRDRMVKLKTHESPREEVVESKEGEIVKNIALILVQQKKIDEAKEIIVEARKLNPDDTSLAMTEANLYLETKDFDSYKKLVTEILAKNPNDADLLFNLGVISSEAKNKVDAEMYYNKAIAVNPKYMNAYINLVGLKLEAETPINAEMNKLGTSDKDNKRYEVLKNEKKKIYQGVIPVLVKALEIDPTNKDIGNTLASVYGALEMSAEKKALTTKLGL
ncbi:tetratricopeptide repeat protein [Flavobacterium algicola]|uniref:tetratricopeptide repeat protein n=1 Tax=Flavobacterium algicola TaxID=556529 RepID=UPI001EFEBA42|nr:tetratricopeptide repeat protein [Flavobacterium algicola]MCG9792378.1 tetratricopeptide repeat protein [Flavobacterium algicola]